MANKVRLLSEHMINQIAAGEVIENPASLVKELVENSLDAGATKITVEVMGGGLQKIVVSDNGCGMSEEDALLSLERHATSKMQDLEDLWRVMTMGFRGEALASIAAVSRFTMQTAESAGVGTQVEVEGGKRTYQGPCSRVQGTTIEIRNLFYNVPARKKFQKPPAYCLAEVSKVVTALALSHPFVCFELYQVEQGPLFILPPLTTRDPLEALSLRAKKLLGEEFVQGSFVIQGEFTPFSCYGILGSLQNTRPNRQLQYQFLNRRSVLCPTISYAVKEALGTRIEEKRFPVYALHIDVPHDFIDVNVHPQKREIRLREEKYFSAGLKKVIEQAFIPSSTFSTLSPIQPLQPERPDPLPWEMAPPAPLADPLIKDSFAEEAIEFVYTVEPQVIGLYEHFLWILASSVSLERFPKEGMVMVHLQRASSQLLWDALCDAKQAKESQMLFLPLTWSCSVYEAQKILAGMEEIQKMGFSLQESRGAFLVEAIPPALGEMEALEFLQDYLLSEEGERSKRLAKITTKISSQRKISYTMEGALAVCKAVLQSSSPYISPTGEKTLIHMGTQDMEKLFSKMEC